MNSSFRPNCACKKTMGKYDVTVNQNIAFRWRHRLANIIHYIDVIMTTMASHFTSLTVVYSTVYSDADQRKHQSSAPLAFAWGFHRYLWIPRTKGQLRGKRSIWWRYHEWYIAGRYDNCMTRNELYQQHTCTKMQFRCVVCAINLTLYNYSPELHVMPMGVYLSQ